MCAFWAKHLNVPTEPKAVPFKPPVFLLGLMRSGTTMLMNILCEHPQLLKVGFELNKVWTEIGGAPCSTTDELRTKEDYSPEFGNNMTAYFQSFIEESKSMKRHLARWSAKRYYGSGGVFYDWENVHPMNKSPHLSNKVGYINQMFPNAKYIVLLRSLEGQVASLKMHFLNHHKTGNWNFYLPEKEGSGWSNLQGDFDKSKYEESRIFPGNFELLAESWLNLNRRMFQDLEFIPSDQKVFITYEDLVENRSESLHRIFSVLDLDKKHQNKVEAIKQSQRKIQNTTTKGNPLEKWKSYLDAKEIEALKAFKEIHNTEIEAIYNAILI